MTDSVIISWLNKNSVDRSILKLYLTFELKRFGWGFNLKIPPRISEKQHLFRKYGIVQSSIGHHQFTYVMAYI